MNLLKKAMLYEYPKQLPVMVGILPAAWIKYGDELVRLMKDYPDLYPVVPDLDHLEAIIPPSYHYGTFTDEWGCLWGNIDEGMESIVTGHPVKTREDIIHLKIPENNDGRLPHGFMYLRLLDLRGFEEAMIDFAEECDELQILIDKVLEYNCRQIRTALPNADEITYFGDDLGIQTGLAIGAEKWRKYLKPCYRKMYQMVRDAGKLVYMHSDGRIIDIMPDLQECGVNMINPQFRANGLDDLARVCRGKIPINLDLDRQLFPFATPSQLDDHVRACVEALFLPQGGLGLNIEFNYEIPLENMDAVLSAARKYRMYKG
ncbi:MAG: uroporphyrinogen decarboxylase family protein [Clostridiaceae bacterium]|nr:uroporphyrinogen decarboxylase family protein [Clostridiaceae bacterium]